MRIIISASLSDQTSATPFVDAACSPLSRELLAAEFPSSTADDLRSVDSVDSNTFLLRARARHSSKNSWISPGSCGVVELLTAAKY